MDGFTPAETAIRRGSGARRAQTGQAYKDIGAFILADTEGPCPVPQRIMVSAASPEASRAEGMGAVDRWAAAHGVRAAWVDGAYEASVHFGPVAYVVFWLPLRKLRDLDARNSYRGNVQTESPVAA